ncbi:hypothetical protein EZV62_010223 [Acer yangbiense]|uniref:Tubulin-specific chaperone A n=1 Tax=Acer yangbiense TaxID=1000413 RepID=A0A5C7I2S6_9ROSI|nr:hypothetical protein EZV62_010223 [Acer yangbiense]
MSSSNNQATMATVRNLKMKKEVEREATKTVDMKDKGAESRIMIPDCRKRLEGVLADLKGNLAELEEPLEERIPYTHSPPGHWPRQRI